MRTKNHTLRKQKGRAYGYVFENVVDACLQLAKANDSTQASQIYRDAALKFHPDKGGNVKDFQDLKKCLGNFWPANRVPAPTDIRGLSEQASRARQQYIQQQGRAPAPPAPAPPAPAQPAQPAPASPPQFPIKCMVFKSQGAVVFGDLTEINSNKTFKIGNANYDPNTVQPIVKDPRFAKISDWRNWLLNSVRRGGFTLVRRLPSLPTQRAPRFSSSKKKRYTHRRRALRTGKGGYQPIKTDRTI